MIIDLETTTKAAQAGNTEACAEIDEHVAAGELDWHAQRRTGLGGSDIAAILGLDSWRKPIDVWQEKTGRTGPGEDSEPAKWGRILEPIVADEYARAEQIVLRGPFGTVRDSLRPWHLATIDRAIVSPTGKIERIIDIKCRGWHRLDDYGEPGSADVPASDACQLAWYMHAYQCNRASIAALFNGNNVRSFNLDRDPELELELLDRCDQWWRDHVLADNPPEADGSESYSRWLAKYDAGRGLVIPTTQQLAALERLRQLECLFRAVRDARELARQRIGEQIADYDGIDLAASGDGKLSYTTQRGRIRDSAVIAELAERLGIGPKQLAAIKEKHRGADIRVMRTPRSWSKDELADYLPAVSRGLAELAGTTEGESQ